eukprot:3489682-Amphidinium_carterae.1
MIILQYHLRSLSATSTVQYLDSTLSRRTDYISKLKDTEDILDLARGQAETQLDYIGHHFYLKATVFNGLYAYVDYRPHFANWYHGWYDENDSNKKIYGLLQDDAEQIDYD